MNARYTFQPLWVSAITQFFVSPPRTKDVVWRPCQWNRRTYTLFSSSFHGHLSLYKAFDVPSPICYYLFSCLFGCKAATRCKNLSTRAPSPDPAFVDMNFIYSSQKLTQYGIKVLRILPNWSLEMLLQLGHVSLCRLNRISVIDTGFKKRTVGSKIKQPHMCNRVPQAL